MHDIWIFLSHNFKLMRLSCDFYPKEYDPKSVKKVRQSFLASLLLIHSIHHKILLRTHAYIHPAFLQWLLRNQCIFQADGSGKTTYCGSSLGFSATTIIYSSCCNVIDTSPNKCVLSEALSPYFIGFLYFQNPTITSVFL